MFLKTEPPDAFAVLAHGRRYPVRAGVFLIDDADRHLFGPPFVEAGDFPDWVARELVRLGNWDAEEPIQTIFNEPEPASVPDPPLDNPAVSETATGDEKPDVLDVDSLPSRTRSELNTLATELGVTDPEKLPNKVAVIKAITEAHANQ